MNITRTELQAIVNKVGLTKASKQLKCGYLTIKQLCNDLNVVVVKKTAGRKKNVNLSN